MERWCCSRVFARAVRETADGAAARSPEAPLPDVLARVRRQPMPDCSVKDAQQRGLLHALGSA
eukprot:5677240-Amphidinium_carterae.1